MTSQYDIYLICPIALEIAASLDNPQVFFDLSTELQAGRLTFTDLVAMECIKYSSDSPAALWIAGARSSAQGAVVDWHSIQAVQDEVPEILDDLIDDEQANCQIAALAWEMHHDSRRVCVVTDDIFGSPVRLDLTAACARLGLPTLRFREYYPAHLG